MARNLNPGELQIDLFCKGMRIDDNCRLEEDASMIVRSRAGLGSGLEVILPDDIYVNVPVVEYFAKESPYLIRRKNGDYVIKHETAGCEYPVGLPKQPKFYLKKTKSGKQMYRVGIIQGTYLGIYPSKKCGFWDMGLNCKFCQSGLNIGEYEEAEKTVDDVVETALAAKEELGVTFIHFNTGYYGGTAIEEVLPYVKGIKERVGMIVGVQVPPQMDLSKYDQLFDLGVEHLSFCFEFFSHKTFSGICPGKEKYLKQKAFYDAMEYTANKWLKGSVSGEIIVGVEPIEETHKAIEFITDMGCFPTICVFRPTVGTAMEKSAPPDFEEILPVYRHMFEACMLKKIPTGIAPNLKISIVPQPIIGEYLVPHDLTYKIYKTKMAIMKFYGAHFVFKNKLATPAPKM